MYTLPGVARGLVGVARGLVAVAPARSQRGQGKSTVAPGDFITILFFFAAVARPNQQRKVINAITNLQPMFHDEWSSSLCHTVFTPITPSSSASMTAVITIVLYLILRKAYSQKSLMLSDLMVLSLPAN